MRIKYPATAAAVTILLGTLALHFHTVQAVGAMAPAAGVAAPAGASRLWKAAMTAGALPETKALPLQQQIDALIAAGTPAKAFDAYGLISNCLYFKEYDKLPLPARDMRPDDYKAEAELCSGMTERIKTARLDYLAIAARAGVMGADTAFLREGPFGDPNALLTRPDDLLVQAWKRQAMSQLTSRAMQADVGTLNVLFVSHLGGAYGIEKNKALAFEYGLALSQIQTHFDGLQPALNLYSRIATSDGLSAGQIASAHAVADQIEATWLSHKNLVRN